MIVVPLYGNHMHKVQEGERILNRNVEAQPETDRLNREWAGENFLSGLASCDPLVQNILDNQIDRFLGSGAFAREYAIDTERVLKLTQDLTSLKIMQKLCDRSSYFPRVHLLLEEQVLDEEVLCITLRSWSGSKRVARNGLSQSSMVIEATNKSTARDKCTSAY